jgi:hypothetical protein
MFTALEEGISPDILGTLSQKKPGTLAF